MLPPMIQSKLPGKMTVPGDQISSAMWNGLQHKVDKIWMMMQGPGYDPSRETRIHLVEINDGVAGESSSSSLAGSDAKQASALYWTGSAWAKNTADNYDVEPDPNGEIALETGDRLLIFLHHQSGKYLPFLSGSAGGATIKLGKLDADLTAGGSVTVSVWSGTAGSETDSTTNETAYDWLGMDLPSGTSVFLLEINTYYYIVGLDNYVRLAVLDADLEPGGSVAVSFYEGTPGSEADNGEGATAYDWLGLFVPSGSQVYCLRMFGNWYVVALPNMRMGVLDTCLEAGGSATMSIWSGTPGSESDSGVNVTVYDWLLADDAILDVGVKVIAAPMNGYWYVVAAQCDPDCGCTGTTTTADVSGGQVAPSAAPKATSTSVLVASSVKATRVANLYNAANFK